jgi:hypothetical protein
LAMPPNRDSPSERVAAVCSGSVEEKRPFKRRTPDGDTHPEASHVRPKAAAGGQAVLPMARRDVAALRARHRGP